MSAYCLLVICFWIKLARSEIQTAEETQHAICNVITKDANTTANATVRRELKGVCTDKQIEHRLQVLEQNLMEQLKTIQIILNNTITNKGANQGQHNERTLTDNGPKYGYTWEISNMFNILIQHGIQLNSPAFSVRGHELHLQLHPHHLDQNYVGIQLQTTQNDIVWHQYRFSIRNGHQDSGHIASPLFTSPHSIYRVPYGKLHEKHYLQDDTVIVQVAIYFN